MKLHAKSNIIILIFLGIIFSLSPFFITAANFSIRNMESSSEISDEIKYDNLNLKISAISGKIHINNNWSAAKFAGICTGNGTFSEPYVIEDWVIDANNIESGILIENSDVYFIIENCTVYNSGYFPDAGIKLNNITNSHLINNDCSSNYNGIYLYNSKNITISGNTVNNNAEYGINLYHSNNNTVLGNIANNNFYGIDLYHSNNNTISGNDADLNNIYGLYLSYSNNNTVSGNNANYNKVYGIHLYNNTINNILGNTADHNLYGISLTSSYYNIISGNIANLNHDNGLDLSDSDNNTISGNTAFNNDNIGIKLSDSDNNTVSGNTADQNLWGIHLNNSDNNSISGNIADDNYWDGISVGYSSFNVITGNSVNYNGDGIQLHYSDYNYIIGNNASNQLDTGIYLLYSDNNLVSGNNLNFNDRCWREINCDGNFFENNDCEDRSYPPGYFNPPYLLSILIGVTTFIGIVILIRYLNNRGFFLKRKYRGLKYVPNKPLQQAPQGTINRTNFCANCGAPVITKEDLFCSNCGQNLK